VTDADWVLRPSRMWTRSEVLAADKPVPAAGGVYAWFFDELPDERVDRDACHQVNEWTLLYVGISPKRPPRNGKPPSSQTLRSRVRYHMRGNAEGSTLRLSLGCLLTDRLGIELRRVGSGERMTFGGGEDVLSAWLNEHARVVWVEHPEPWVLEEELIGELYLPLNLDQNRDHPFHAVISGVRSEAKRSARDQPVVT